MAVLVGVAVLVASVPAAAQQRGRPEPSPAEFAIATGRFAEAEAALFAAVSAAPREPSARGALGAFLAARGRFLVGTVLLDEAVRFGADTATVQSRQLEIFRWAGEFGRAAALPAARMSGAEREAFQRSGLAAVSGARLVTVPLRPNELAGLGRIRIGIGDVELDADIDPSLPGLFLPSTLEIATAVEPTGASGDTTFAVAQWLKFGGLRLGPVPVALIPGRAVARIGLNLLGRLTPTFGSGELTLRADPPSVAAGESWPVMLMFPGITLVPGTGAAPVMLHQAAGRAVLRGREWTLDLSKGEIAVTPR